MSDSHLTQIILDAFNALADEVQQLADRRIVLEQKLHFAHEQFQSLADKYAPAAPDIAKTLANLQPPPYHSIDDTSPVPILKRRLSLSQHQVALIIRDGRRAASKLASLGQVSKTTPSTRGTLSQVSLVETSMPTTLEQDFTVQGRKGHLQCPFSRGVSVDDAAGEAQPDKGSSSPPPISAESHCASLSEDSAFVNNGVQASKCPIRFIDERSPEEIAQYVETHKHELPRSHELCLRRYQRNEEQIKKLDSKYGNIVSMIEDLSQLHKPMLPEGDPACPRSIGTRDSHDRVETWAQEVGASAGAQTNHEDPESPETTPAQVDVDDDGDGEGDGDDDRQGRFDRPLKEVRVGESPSRPWGISVPFHESFDDSIGLPISPPPAPVRMPISTRLSQSSVHVEAKKCPFDHTKFSSFAQLRTPSDHDTNNHDPAPYISQESAHSTQAKETMGSVPLTTPHVQSQPVFINSEASKAAAPNVPQMIFTGPVFIGYSMEQAIQFMNQTQRNH